MKTKQENMHYTRHITQKKVDEILSRNWYKKSIAGYGLINWLVSYLSRASAKKIPGGEPTETQDRKIASLSFPLLYQYHVWKFGKGRGHGTTPSAPRCRRPCLLSMDD